MVQAIRSAGDRSLPGSAEQAGVDAMERHEQTQQSLRFAWALCYLCRTQFDGEIPQDRRTPWPNVMAVFERIEMYLEDADEYSGDIHGEAPMLLHQARATLALLLSDGRCVDAQHSSDEICSWCLWSLSDDIEAALALVEGAAND